MNVSESARLAIKASLENAPSGSLPVLVVGYRYHEDERIPFVEIEFYPPKSIAEDSLQVYDGLTFYEVLPDSRELIRDRTLLFEDGSFLLSAQ